jgi:hypothetical protein
MSFRMFRFAQVMGAGGVPDTSFGVRGSYVAKSDRSGEPVPE